MVIICKSDVRKCVHRNVSIRATVLGGFALCIICGHKKVIIWEIDLSKLVTEIANYMFARQIIVTRVFATRANYLLLIRIFGEWCSQNGRTIVIDSHFERLVFAEWANYLLLIRILGEWCSQNGRTICY